MSSYLMVLLWYTCSQLPTSLHSRTMQVECLFHTSWSSWIYPEELMWSGTPTLSAASKSQPERDEEKVYGERWQARPRSHAGNWPDFLRDPTNKQELFHFLSEKISSTDCPDEKQIFITSGATVFGRGTDHCMPPCDHEEADTRIVIHLQDALENGCATCLVRTVDTDVVVILIGKYHSLINKYPAADIWVAFGTGKELHVSTHQCHLPHPGEREVHGAACVSQFHRMWHNFRVLWKGEEVDMGSMVCLPWSHWSLQLHRGTSSHSSDSRLPAVPAARTLHCHHLWRNQQSTVCERSTQGALLLEEQDDGEDSSNTRRYCSTQSVSHTRLESGQHVIRPNSKPQLQMVAAGH